MHLYYYSCSNLSLLLFLFLGLALVIVMFVLVLATVIVFVLLPCCPLQPLGQVTECKRFCNVPPRARARGAQACLPRSIQPSLMAQRPHLDRAAGVTGLPGVMVVVQVVVVVVTTDLLIGSFCIKFPLWLVHIRSERVSLVVSLPLCLASVSPSSPSPAVTSFR